jgi:hypothetical protein
LNAKFVPTKIVTSHISNKNFIDCEADRDCEIGLVCFQRENGTSEVPGCDGDADLLGNGDEDYCIERPTDDTLVIMGDDEEPKNNFPLGKCEGDCDEDKDCNGNLICYQRGDNNPNESVPGCQGTGSSKADYCSFPPTWPPGSDQLVRVADDNLDEYLQRCQSGKIV